MGEAVWGIALLYAMGLAAGMIVGFPVWAAVGRLLRPRLRTGTRNWAVFGMALGVPSGGGVWAWWRIQWVSVPEAVPWFSEVLAALVFGLWSAFVFGVAFGHRLAESRREPATGPG